MDEVNRMSFGCELGGGKWVGMCVPNLVPSPHLCFAKAPTKCFHHLKENYDKSKNIFMQAENLSVKMFLLSVILRISWSLLLVSQHE